MHAMQYEVTLPADYDMAIIRQRVASRGALLDRLPGLGLKAYAVRTRGTGSPVNQYAPFYLWRNEESMARFLAGEGFRGLCESFGRPRVNHWIGLAYEQGPAFDAVPRAASREIRRVDPSADLDRVLADAHTEARRAASRHGAHSLALALDPRSWELASFSLWSDFVPPGESVSYQLLHVSAPELGGL